MCFLRKRRRQRLFPFLLFFFFFFSASVHYLRWVADAGLLAPRCPAPLHATALHQITFVYRLMDLWSWGAVDTIDTNAAPTTVTEAATLSARTDRAGEREQHKR